MHDNENMAANAAINSVHFTQGALNGKTVYIYSVESKKLIESITTEPSSVLKEPNVKLANPVNRQLLWINCFA